MKNTVLAILLFTASFSFAQEVQQIPDSLGIDSLQTKVMKLIDFYESYDDNSPESLKKSKYDDAINEISNGTASEQDKKDAYIIIDAYIKGDKAIEENTNPQEEVEESFENLIKNTEEVKNAEALVEQQKTDLMQMSYSEFEGYVEASNPMVTKREIKEYYNLIHKNDGRAVIISSSDDILTEEQIKVNAFLQLESASTYEEFEQAIQILNPNVSKEEIRKAWENK